MSRLIKEFSAFAQAADFIDDESFNTCLVCLEHYFRNRFGAEFWELLRPINNRDDETELEMIWSKQNLKHRSRVIDDKGVPTGQSAFCYLEGLPMWVTLEFPRFSGHRGYAATAAGWLSRLNWVGLV